MEEIGRVWATDTQKHSEIVKRAYAPLLIAAPKDGVAVSRNVAYGPHPRQVVDIFQPVIRSNAPVAIFVHGWRICARRQVHHRGNV